MSSHSAHPQNENGGAGVPPACSPSSFAFLDGKERVRTGGDLPHREHAGAHYFITFRLHDGQLNLAERQIVLDACLFWHGKRYYLGAAVVMPDHVHLLFRILQQPDGSWPTLAGLLHSIKLFTAHRILKDRGSVGPLWQPEYLDRLAGSPHEYEEYVQYILLNPRRAGLTKDDEHYPFVHRYPSARVQGGLESLDSARQQRISAGVESHTDAGGTPASPAGKDCLPHQPASP